MLRIVALSRSARHPAPLRLVVPTCARCVSFDLVVRLAVFFAEAYQGSLVLMMVIRLVVTVRLDDDRVWHLFALRGPNAGRAKPIDSILMDLLLMCPSI